MAKDSIIQHTQPEMRSTGMPAASKPSARSRSAWQLVRDAFARLDLGIKVLALVFLVTIPLLTPRVAASDEIEYYSYLHSIVFDHDLNFRDEYEHFCRNPGCVSPTFSKTFLEERTPTGLQINFGPIGSALLWAPFYLLAHLAALGLHAFIPRLVADGYSAPYIYAISFASLLYGWLGLALSYRLAREFVDEKIALGATLAILLATNAVYYMYVAPAMSHAPSLFASALFVFVWYHTRRTRAEGEWRAWALLGGCGALMTMVREQEGLFILIPLAESALMLVGSVRRARQNRVALSFPQSLRPYVLGPLTMSAAWFVVFIPQLLVYRVLNGNFLPAKDVTQKFTWDGAHIGDVLFSNQHGLISWTPLVLFAVCGLFSLWRRDKILAAVLLLALAAEVYLLGSFSTWFGGAGFGMRRFVNCTVLFVVGLAALVDMLKTRVPVRILAGVGTLFVIWNLFFIVQFATGMISRELPVDFSQLAYNQVFVVPSRLAGIAWRFITARGTFYK